MKIAKIKIFAVTICTLSATHAWSRDIDISTFPVDDARQFVALSGDLALSVRPHFAGPAATTGSRGFDIGYALAITDIDENADHWQSVSDTPEPTLLASQIVIRKGLPYSVELGGVLTYLHETDLWALAVTLQWAFVEGFDNAPDVALRIHGGTMMGSKDISLSTAGADLVMSKAFGIAGLVRFIPFIGYAFTYAHSSSHVLGDFSPWSPQPTPFLQEVQHTFLHRGVAGIRLQATIVDLGFEVSLGELQTYAMRAAFVF